jgi:hypothetical protein
MPAVRVAVLEGLQLLVDNQHAQPVLKVCPGTLLAYGKAAPRAVPLTLLRLRAPVLPLPISARCPSWRR